jgi:hypothetical protein
MYYPRGRSDPVAGFFSGVLVLLVALGGFLLWLLAEFFE